MPDFEDMRKQHRRSLSAGSNQPGYRGESLSRANDNSIEIAESGYHPHSPAARSRPPSPLIVQSDYSTINPAVRSDSLFDNAASPLKRTGNQTESLNDASPRWLALPTLSIDTSRLDARSGMTWHADASAPFTESPIIMVTPSEATFSVGQPARRYHYHSSAGWCCNRTLASADSLRTGRTNHGVLLPFAISCRTTSSSKSSLVASAHGFSL